MSTNAETTAITTSATESQNVHTDGVCIGIILPPYDQSACIVAYSIYGDKSASAMRSGRPFEPAGGDHVELACPSTTARRRICNKLVRDQRLHAIWRHGNGGGDTPPHTRRGRVDVLARALDPCPQPPSQAAVVFMRARANPPSHRLCTSRSG